jgi:hypothetical protein
MKEKYKKVFDSIWVVKILLRDATEAVQQGSHSLSPASSRRLDMP